MNNHKGLIAAVIVLIIALGGASFYIGFLQAQKIAKEKIQLDTTQNENLTPSVTETIQSEASESAVSPTENPTAVITETVAPTNGIKINPSIIRFNPNLKLIATSTPTPTLIPIKNINKNIFQKL